uniref:TSC22 domain family protein 1 n=1 Tax=Ditylenchus dipsaci TaxID=166011 RepID=A0A915DAL9_9BILA
MEVLIQRAHTNLVMATTATAVIKPKERQFQVVPVPAIFTRGRWECRDFKEAAVDSQILEFIDKHAASYAADHEQHNTPSTLPFVAVPNNNTQQQQKQIILTGLPAGPASIILPDISSPSTVPATLIGGVNDGLVAAATAGNPPSQFSDSSNTPSSVVASMTGTSNVAIDNKIEQAMDLVKTHLTYAVREEVELLRVRISDLEKQVNSLENENQIMRQFTPADVVANLPLLIQQNQHKASQQSNPPAISESFQAAPPSTGQSQSTPNQESQQQQQLSSNKQKAI